MPGNLAKVIAGLSSWDYPQIFVSIVVAFSFRKLLSWQRR